MRLMKLFATVLCFSVVATTVLAQSDKATRSDLEFHDGLLTIDTHIDIGPGFGTSFLDPGVINRAQVNLPSMRIGGLDAGFFVVFTPQGDMSEQGYAKAKDIAEDKYYGILRMLRAYPDTIGLAKTAEDVEALHASGKLIALIGLSAAGAHSAAALARVVLALRISNPWAAIVLSGQIANEDQDVISALDVDGVVKDVPSGLALFNQLWEKSTGL